MKVFVLKKRFIIILAALCTVGAAAGFFAATRSTPTFRVGNREIPIYCVERGDNKIALTFDCAWNADDVENICSTLDAYNAKATFFAVGDWAEKYPDAVKQFAQKGHEIGNHSYNHAHYKKLSKSQMLADMEKCDGILEKLSGKKPTLFRSPYGEYNDTVVKTCDSSGRTYIQWSVDSIDYGDASADDILRRATTNVKSGDILLLHNGTKNTAAALPQILKTLSDRGFEFVTVSELIYTDNYTIDHSGKQIKNNN